MLTSMLNLSKRLLLFEFESIINQVVENKSIDVYPEDMHPYIRKNHDLETFVQSKIVLNKKFFNLIQKSKIFSIHLITEAWCLDACTILPLLKSINIIKPEIGIYIYLRDQNESLMNQYLTNGSKSIPIVFGLDEKHDEIFRWGPRSKKAMDVLEPVKTEPYGVKSGVLKEFYKSDLTESIQLEWIDLLK